MTRERLDCRDRQDAASNSECPLDWLGRLARDEDGDVRFRAARNPNTSQEALKVLAGDKNWDVRRNVARHPACPPELLEQLAGDEHGAVRTAAREQREQREQHRREATCADYAAELDTGSIGCGGGL